MIKAEQIPDEVWHTAMSTYHKTIRKNPGTAWQEAIAAALNAWPGIVTEGEVEVNANGGLNGYYLPLPEAPQGRMEQSDND